MFASLRSRLLVLLLILAVAVLGWLFLWNSDNKRITEYPEYLNFKGSYVFAIPQGHIVDELSLSGMQLVYHGPRKAKNLGEAYNDNTISLQPIKDMSDNKSSTFKKYVNEALIPDFKKNVSNEYTLKFSSFDGWDVARITASKDGKPLRFVYVKNGKHPVIVVAKEESEAIKKIQRSLTDVETSDLKDDNASLRKTVLGYATLVKEQRGADLYKESTQALKDKTKETDFINVLKAAAPFTQGGITIHGVAYSLNPNRYVSVMVLGTNNPDTPSITGTLIIEKVNGKWQLNALQLPSPS